MMFTDVASLSCAPSLADPTRGLARSFLVRLVYTGDSSRAKKRTGLQKMKMP